MNEIVFTLGTKKNLCHYRPPPHPWLTVSQSDDDGATAAFPSQLMLTINKIKYQITLCVLCIVDPAFLPRACVAHRSSSTHSRPLDVLTSCPVGVLLHPVKGKGHVVAFALLLQTPARPRIGQWMMVRSRSVAWVGRVVSLMLRFAV